MYDLSSLTVEKVGLIKNRLNFNRFCEGALYVTAGLSSWAVTGPIKKSETSNKGNTFLYMVLADNRNGSLF